MHLLIGHNELFLIKISQNTITARSFKLEQLIEDNEKITWLKYKKKVVFFSYCPIENL